ncbi:unnamed protein product [Larinioides sclopetarius]|uniref:Uncharacterized protein n=1 Tax=Larinioides sclopetarius TaxID=280406 RepID=A0AAV1YYU6_9ARAC
MSRSFIFSSHVEIKSAKRIMLLILRAPRFWKTPAQLHKLQQ